MTKLEEYISTSCIITLSLFVAPPLSAGIGGAGGSALASWPTSQSCTYHYYMPPRVYLRPAFQAEIDSTLQNNANQGAQRVRLPIYFNQGDLNIDPPDVCDLFHTDLNGTLSPLLTNNLSALFRTMRSQGYWEVLMSFAAQAPNNPVWTDAGWSGSSSAWTSQNESVYQMNFKFIKNVLAFVFLSTNNSGLYVSSDLGGEIFPPVDNNCANYEPGRCGDLRYHYTYGKTAQYIARMWQDIATTQFTDGSSWFTGKDRVYGFGLGPDNIAAIYSLYDRTTAGRPWLVPLGMYPTSGTAATNMFIAAHNSLMAVNDSTSGIIISETYYNNAALRDGFKAGMNQTGRGISFLIQWPLLLVDGKNDTMVLPTNFNNYNPPF